MKNGDFPTSYVQFPDGKPTPMAPVKESAAASARRKANIGQPSPSFPKCWNDLQTKTRNNHRKS